MTTAAVPGALNVLLAGLSDDQIIALSTSGPPVAQTTLKQLRQYFLNANVAQVPIASVTTDTLQAATIPVADIVGAESVNFTNTGTTPGNLQLPTAAAIVAALKTLLGQLPAVNYGYELNVRNGSGSANTATLTTNTGLTLNGTMTIAQNVTRSLIVTVTNAAAGSEAVTFTSMGVSAAGA